MVGPSPHLQACLGGAVCSTYRAEPSKRMLSLRVQASPGAFSRPQPALLLVSADEGQQATRGSSWEMGAMPRQESVLTRQNSALLQVTLFHRAAGGETSSTMLFCSCFSLVYSTSQCTDALTASPCLVTATPHSTFSPPD